MNFLKHKLKAKTGIGLIKKTLIKLYFASPPKIQFALARYGVKAIVNNNKQEIEEIIRH